METRARFWRWLRELRLDLAALIWPTRCVGCGAPDRDCCDACRAELRELGDPLRSSLPVPGGSPVPAPLPGDVPIPGGRPVSGGAAVPVFAAGRYDGPLRALIVGLKHGGQVGFARELAVLLEAPLAAAWACAGAGRASPIVVAVPSRAERVRSRGYRHVELVLRRALRAGGRAHLPLLRALRALPGRSGQVALDAGARARNAARIAVRPGCRRALRGRDVVLVDDIVTTGATAAAACRVLTAEGARVIAVVTLGLVPRRDAPKDSGWSGEGRKR